jgi:hypothetical protein
MPTTIIPLRVLPGIKRDGTLFEGENYVDGQWVRWQRGLPRKIGGYAATNHYLPEICRGLHTYTQNLEIYCHSGSKSFLSRFILDINGNSIALVDRTPDGFIINDENEWMFDVMFSSVSLENNLIAHVTADNDNIVSTNEGYIYYGDISGVEPLTEITVPDGIKANGGIVVLHPYLVYYGESGLIGWSVAGKPDDLTGSGSGSARVTGQKIVKGMPLRAGAGSAPAGLFWSYNSLIRMSFVGGDAVFQFDTISVESSILSKNSVIEYDGIYYWCGVDRFLMFNGVVREIENKMNINWFFDNLNQNCREKVFSFKVPRYGEIWWCFPFGDAIECSHAVIFNIRENTWYDTRLPTSGRTAASFSQLYAAPLLSDAAIYSPDDYSIIWRHEYGVNCINTTSVQPISSYFETCDLSLPMMSQQNKAMELSYIEPDFIQTNNMSVTVTGRRNARSKTIESNTVIFPDNAIEIPSKQVIMMKEQRRELRLRFESNILNGDYQMGQVLLHIDSGDGSVLP